ncbi:hypothetical protein cypCar_00032823 [Cyprinus carpio]|nr:hypothetical protein cypCar_00032823 [Cyprinus carpio]
MYFLKCADSVFLQAEDLRNEYVRSDFGLLFKGSPCNVVSRPWSFDQFEKGILDICMKLLQLSPQYQADMRTDLKNRSDPVYIGRVISAMVNSNDDKGVLMGNWSGDYSGGINPSQWSGSADILRKWNFHVWVESWMKRPDLGQGYDGWQVLDATPQERSAGIFRCGPAAVKAIYQQKVDAQYDVPFVYAAVNADVRTIIIKDRKILSTSTDTKRVGSLISTKRPGSMLMQDITSEYKTEKDESTVRALSTDVRRGEGATGRVASKGTAVSLQLLKAPVVGENISFNVIITNNAAAPQLLKKHVNAQNKEYNRNPTGTFWEAHDDVKIGPNQTLTIKHEISFKDYMLKEVEEDSLVNLAVVIEDVKSQERVLATEEFNIRSPALTVQIQNEYVVINTQQVATVTFTNPFSTAVSGELTVACSGLLEQKVQTRITIQPRETMRMPISFTPRMAGSKMLYASLVLTNPPTVLHGFKSIDVQAA